MIWVALCALLFLAGHVLRDGWPATGSTQTARAGGALFCAAGAYLALPNPWWFCSVVFATILGGFFVDTDHAKGQGATSWLDAWWLTISGVTSVALLAIGVTIFHWLYLGSLAWVPGASILAMALVKPPVWFAAKYLDQKYRPGLAPYYTQISASIFGVAIGTVLGLVA